MTGTFVERVWEVTPLESEIRQAIDQLSNTQPLKIARKRKQLVLSIHKCKAKLWL